MDRALCPVLVGRERELSLLEDALLAAHRGSGQVVVIAGEAGVGKTRLAMELQERARRARTAVMVGTTSEADVALPYLPFIEAIGNYLAGADLEPLPPAGVARMVSAIFDNAPVEAELRDFLHDRTEGNPFVLEELLKAALDRGDIFLTAGGWDRKAIHQLRLPPTVKQAILLRVERMSEEQADILRAAAVLGRSFDYRMLVGVSQQPVAAVLNALRSFVQDQLMDEETSGLYRFRHALTREAIHDDLIAPERERLHACAADWLRTQLFPD